MQWTAELEWKKLIPNSLLCYTVLFSAVLQNTTRFVVAVSMRSRKLKFSVVPVLELEPSERGQIKRFWISWNQNYHGWKYQKNNTNNLELMLITYRGMCEIILHSLKKKRGDYWETGTDFQTDWWRSGWFLPFLERSKLWCMDI